ncbi:MAG: hypothetical protein QOD63_1880 [Actinomycetota bacterium]|nr:hypothetical protein [Actinomycetota bacterium]
MAAPWPDAGSGTGAASADAQSHPDRFHPDQPSDSGGDPATSVAATEVAPLVGLRRVPTMGLPAATVPGELSPVGRDPGAVLQRQAASLVTAPDPFRTDFEHSSGAASAGPGADDLQVRVAPLMGDRPLPARSHTPSSTADAAPTETRHPGATGTPGPLLRPAAPRFATVQRAGAADRSGPTAGHTPASGAGAEAGFVDAGAVAVAAGIAHRAADGSVVFGPGASSPAAEWRPEAQPAASSVSPAGHVPTARTAATARTFAVQRARAGLHDTPVTARPIGLQRALTGSPPLTGSPSLTTTDGRPTVRRLPTDSPGTQSPNPRAAAESITGSSGFPDDRAASWASVPVQRLDAASPPPTWVPTSGVPTSGVPTSGVSVQQEAAPAEVSSPPPVEAPAAPPDPAGGAAALAAAAAGAPAGAAAPAGTGPAPMTDREVDRLARRLYPRLRDHLRGELRLDRERLGRASDVGMRN